MRLIIEEVDGAIYMDIILKEEEGELLQKGTLLDSMAIMKTTRYYVGVRIGDKWIYKDSPSFLDNNQAE